MGLIAITEPDDAGTLTASGAGSGTDVAALFRTQPTDVWAAAAPGAAWVVQDAGAALDIDTVALLYTNMPVGSTWRVRVADSQANLTAAPLYDSGALAFADFHGSARTPRRHLYHRMPAVHAARWRRIDVTPANGTFVAGRLVTGRAWEPLVSYGLVRDFAPRVEITDTDGGATVLRRWESAPTIAFQMVTKDQAEFEAALYEVERLSREVLIAYDPAGAHQQKRLYYGLAQGRGFAEPAFSFYQHRIELRGLL